MPRQPDQPNPPQIMVAWQGFATAALPGHGVVSKGATLPADHPAVLAHPEYFVPHGSGKEVFAIAAAELAARDQQ